MARSSKGSKFERDFCTELSQWWTHGKRTDIFWRVQGSGGRAKRRGRGGLDTFGSHGDIAAVDPIGSPLIDLLTIELKRGYSKDSIQDVLDKSIKKPAQQEWEKWFAQVDESMVQSGSYSWMIITRRDQRRSICFMPWKMLSCLWQISEADYPVPLFAFTAMLKTNNSFNAAKEKVAGLLLDDFFACVKPEHVIELQQRV